MTKHIPYEPLGKEKIIVVFIFLLAATWYLPWRAGVLNEKHLVFSVLLYGAELFSFFTIMLHLLITWRLSVRKSPPVSPGMKVAVLIPTLNEPIAMLRQTLLGATRMDYPHQTWLLDDGHRPQMRRLANELGCSYLTRPEHTDAKAGSLNNAMRYVKADFLAIFDADHIPSKDFLTHTLGYFCDDDVAFVQTPQDFYNLDSYQHIKSPRSRSIWSEQSLFFRVIQRGKDYWNAAFFCGSCAVIRRTALDSVGGFATGTVTEDLHTSLRLHKKGYTSVYHPESLAYGLAPLAIGPYLRQRIRWGQGAMQVWRKEGIVFARGLTIPQRINYLASAITYFDGWQKGIFYIAPVLVLVLGWLPIVDISSSTFLWHFVPYYTLTFWAFEEVNRGYGRVLQTELFNMARFWALMVSTLGWFRRRITFLVTPKTSSAIHGEHHDMLPQYTILGANAVAIPFGLWRFPGYHAIPIGALVASMLWASVNIGLAALVVTMTMARRHRRSEYRFPVPIVVRIDDPLDLTELAIAEDISLSGFRIYSRLAQEMAVHGKISGCLLLHDVEIPFYAEVIGGNEGGTGKVRTVGCRFLWRDDATRRLLKKSLV